jgi:hypothetical protein
VSSKAGFQGEAYSGGKGAASWARATVAASNGTQTLITIATPGNFHPWGTLYIGPPSPDGSVSGNRIWAPVVQEASLAGLGTFLPKHGAAHDHPSSCTEPGGAGGGNGMGY